MTQAHDLTTAPRMALVLSVVVLDGNALRQQCPPLTTEFEWDDGDSLLDLLANICRDTEWSPDAFGGVTRTTGGGTMYHRVSAFCDEPPTDIDVGLIVDAIGDVDGLRVIAHDVREAVDA